MSDSISRKGVSAWLYNMGHKKLSEYVLDEKRFQSEDRVTGKWVHRSYYRPSTKMYDCEMYVCNKCGYEYSYDAETGISADSYNYCPNCGAEMRGE